MIRESTSAAKELAQCTPPAVVTAFSIFGYSMQQWVYALTAIYTLFQIVRLLPKMYGCVLCFTKNWTCPRTCKGN